MVNCSGDDDDDDDEAILQRCLFLVNDATIIILVSVPVITGTYRPRATPRGNNPRRHESDSIQ